MARTTPDNLDDLLFRRSSLLVQRDVLTTAQRVKRTRPYMKSFLTDVSVEEVTDDVVALAKVNEHIAELEGRISRVKKDRAKKGLATLADDFRAALFSTSQMGYPLDVLEPDVRGRVDNACRAIIPKLHRAHRIVLDGEFTTLAAKIALSEPVDLARYLEMARLPFDHIWLEWPQPERRIATVGLNYSHDEDIPPRIGVLIEPLESDGEKAYQLITVHGYDHTCAPSPIGMAFSFTQDVEQFSSFYRTRRNEVRQELQYRGDDPTAQRDMDEAPIGFDYMRRTREKTPDQVGLAESIAKRAWMLVAPPLGPLHAETINRAVSAGNTDMAERQYEWLGLNARENNGLWRWIIAVFGLYNTGGEEFVYSETRRQGKQLYDRGRRHLPAYEYRVLRLRRPTTPEIVKKKLPSTSTLGRRWHTVPGSWHHRLAGAECAKHPKICVKAVWKKSYDDDGSPMGNDQHHCLTCGRKKWWVPDHARGDKALGIVDKGYQITATGQPRSHQAIDVVEQFPPGVKIKTTPRFEAVSHKEKTDQHPGRGGDTGPR